MVVVDWPASNVNCRRRCVAIGRRRAAAVAAAGAPLALHYVIVITDHRLSVRSSL